MRKWSPTSPEWFPEESWELHQSAANLTQYACIVSSRHIRDVRVRGRFNRTMAYYVRQVLEDVRSAKISTEEGLKKIEAEHNAVGGTVDYFKASVGLRAGLYQFADGVNMCRSQATCVVGVLAMAHGANNVYENLSNMVTGREEAAGAVRRIYRYAAEELGGDATKGDVVYGKVDITLSFYSLMRRVPKEGAWKLFRRIPSDLQRAYKSMGKVSLVLDGAATGYTIDQVRKDMDKQ